MEKNTLSVDALEAFIEELKAVGVPFVPSLKLKVA